MRSLWINRPCGPHVPARIIFVAIGPGETEVEALTRHLEDRPVDAGAALAYLYRAADGDLVQ